jgi:hypothetical protein
VEDDPGIESAPREVEVEESPRSERAPREVEGEEETAVSMDWNI